MRSRARRIWYAILNGVVACMEFFDGQQPPPHDEVWSSSARDYVKRPDDDRVAKCTRAAGHEGPCNGWARPDCPGYENMVGGSVTPAPKPEINETAIAEKPPETSFAIHHPDVAPEKPAPRPRRKPSGRPAVQQVAKKPKGPSAPAKSRGTAKATTKKPRKR